VNHVETATKKKYVLVNLQIVLLTRSCLVPLFADAAMDLAILKNIAPVIRLLVQKTSTRIQQSFVERPVEIAMFRKLVLDPVLIVPSML